MCEREWTNSNNTSVYIYFHNFTHYFITIHFSHKHFIKSEPKSGPSPVLLPTRVLRGSQPVQLSRMQQQVFHMHRQCHQLSHLQRVTTQTSTTYHRYISVFHNFSANFSLANNLSLNKQPIFPHRLYRIQISPSCECPDGYFDNGVSSDCLVCS